MCAMREKILRNFQNEQKRIFFKSSSRLFKSENFDIELLRILNGFLSWKTLDNLINLVICEQVALNGDQIEGGTYFWGFCLSEMFFGKYFLKKIRKFLVKVLNFLDVMIKLGKIW